VAEEACGEVRLELEERLPEREAVLRFEVLDDVVDDLGEASGVEGGGGERDGLGLVGG
jgi:hypothetical protein